MIQMLAMRKDTNQVAIAVGCHLFPSRTEKLSPLAPMVLHTRGRVGSRHFSRESPDSRLADGASFVLGGGGVALLCC